MWGKMVNQSILYFEAAKLLEISFIATGGIWGWSWMSLLPGHLYKYVQFVLYKYICIDIHIIYRHKLSTTTSKYIIIKLSYFIYKHYIHIMYVYVCIYIYACIHKIQVIHILSMSVQRFTRSTWEVPTAPKKGPPYSWQSRPVGCAREFHSFTLW